MSWCYTPRATLAVAKVDAATQTIHDVYLAGALHDIETTNSTGASMGEASFVLANWDGKVLKDDAAKPHAMDIVCLAQANRRSEWGIEWTGIIDRVEGNLDPNVGDLVTLRCTSPQKYFEIRRQSPNDVLAVSQAAATGVTGSDLLRFACQQARVNFPGPLAHLPRALNQPGPWSRLGWLAIDPHADAGLWRGGVPIGDFTQPDQQSWSAVLSPVAANSGLQWYFDECGRCHWQRPSFLADVATATPIPADELYSLDLAETDETVVTRVEVRWGSLQTVQTASWWQAPPTMVQHLTPRTVVVLAEWIFGENAPQMAQSLATLLGQFYAANLLQGTAIVPPNPAYRVGSLISLPAVRGMAGGVYYVAAKTNKVVAGSTAVAVLGLQYGRAHGAAFPYDVSHTYPSTTSGQALTGAAALSTNAFNLGSSQTVFTLKADHTLAVDVVVGDPALIPAGATVRLYNAAQSTGTNGKSDAAALAGTSPSGHYTVQKGPAGMGAILYVSAIGRYPTVYVTIQEPGTGVDPSLNGSNVGTAPPDVGPSPLVPGTFFPTTPVGLSDTQAVLAHAPANLAQEAFSVAVSYAGYPYVLGSGGPSTFDCSGLVYFAYLQAGYQWAHMGPYGIYRYCLAHGASERPLSQTPVLGDLLFYWEESLSAAQKDNGMGHVGFYDDRDGRGRIFSAMNSTLGIGDFFPYDAGGGVSKPLAHVLNMQTFGTTPVANPLSPSGTGDFTPAQINTDTGLPLAGVTANWPLIYAALVEYKATSHNTQIAAIAMTGKETTVFQSIPEQGGTSASYAPWYGRGFIQLTGSGNYASAGKALGIDLISTDQARDRALEPTTAARILAWYFTSHNIPAMADAGNWQGVADAVNKGDPRNTVFFQYVAQLS